MVKRNNSSSLWKEILCSTVWLFSFLKLSQGSQIRSWRTELTTVMTIQEGGGINGKDALSTLFPHSLSMRTWWQLLGNSNWCFTSFQYLLRYHMQIREKKYLQGRLQLFKSCALNFWVKGVINLWTVYLCSGVIYLQRKTLLLRKYLSSIVVLCIH